MMQTLESQLRRRLSEDTVGSETKGMDTRGADPAGTLSCTALCTAQLCFPLSNQCICPS